MTLEEIIQGILQPQPGVSAGGPGEIVRSRLVDPSQMPRADSGSVMRAGFGSMAPARPQIATARPEPNTGDLGRVVPDAPNAGTPYAPPPQAAAPAPANAPALDLPSTSTIGTFLRGLGKGDGALLSAIGEGIGAVEGQGRNRLAQNQTYQWLISKGSPAEEAAAAIGNPEMLQALVTKHLNPSLTDDQREYAAAQQQGYKGSLVDFIKEGRRTNALRWVNTGTMMEGRDPITGEIVTSTPIDVSGTAAAKAEGKERGEAQGKAQTNLPMAELAAQKMTELLDGILGSSKLDGMTGYAAYLPNVTPEAQELQSRVDQVQGRTFLQAFNDLRGGGAITENEGAKATAAYNRLANMKVTDAGYRAALEEFKRDVADLLAIARQKAAGTYSEMPTRNTQPVPTPGNGGNWSIQRVQ